MKAARCAIFREPNQPFEISEMPLPVCGPGDVLVKISLATICGSDVHTADGKRIEPRPSVLGHEGVGRVLALGKDRDQTLLGKRVTWTIMDSCGHCLPCRDWDLPQKCTRLFKYGHSELSNGSGLNGCYATHILVRPGTTIIPIPDELPDEMAAPANCASTTSTWPPTSCAICFARVPRPSGASAEDSRIAQNRGTSESDGDQMWTATGPRLWSRSVHVSRS